MAAFSRKTRNAAVKFFMLHTNTIFRFVSNKGYYITFDVCNTYIIIYIYHVFNMYIYIERERERENKVKTITNLIY